MSSNSGTQGMGYRICASIPFFNNRKTVDDVAARTHEYVRDLFLVNDGSTDGSESTIQDRPGQVLLHHPVNGGKGAATKTAARYALDHFFTHMIQLDADAQHDPADIPLFLETSRKAPNTLILGNRKFEENVPGSSRFGRRFSNMWFRIETLGYPILDSQCGYRLYPLSFFDGLRSRCNRFDFEAESLVLALRRGYPISHVSINVRYFAGPDRVTHFRHFRDNALISLYHARTCFGIFIHGPAYLSARRQLRRKL